MDGTKSKPILSLKAQVCLSKFITALHSLKKGEPNKPCPLLSSGYLQVVKI